ncbi:unnamed protein product [Arctia plantaginis]|uniref:MAGE domain-containing protein n=1 Tax=Arctia plantaginis TaxID=874455 RepID=A0A8S0ZMD6_ARCPL|nr:unnamed protein product [Arctia plantaginis]
MSQRKVNKSRDTRPDISELEPAIKECVRYILCREGGKIPIKRGDINKHLNTVCQTPQNQVSAIIVEANKVLKKVYGYELLEVAANAGKQYIVILSQECKSILPPIIDEHQRKLLIAALMHIFMSGAPVKEEDMYKFLTDAGLLEENDHASRKLLTTTFTRQMYLEYSKVKVTESNVTRCEFTWGQRAEHEVSKLFLLNKMAEAFGKTPDHWCEQYKEATRET